MKKVLISLLLILTIVILNAQRTQNKVVFDKDVNQKILIGKVDRKAFEKKEFKKWFFDQYNSYQPNQQTIEKLISFIPSNSKITIVMATWCSDSRREVPRFFKILDAIAFSSDNVTIYCVNKKFQAGKEKIDVFQIKKVPTFIYFHYDYEAGRIIETPEESLEEDLLKFTQRK